MVFSIPFSGVIIWMYMRATKHLDEGEDNTASKRPYLTLTETIYLAYAAMMQLSKLLDTVWYSVYMRWLWSFNPNKLAMCLLLIGCNYICSQSALQYNIPTELCTKCLFICGGNEWNLVTRSAGIDSHQNRSSCKSPCIVTVKNWYNYLKMCKWWLSVCYWIDSD